MSEKSLTQPQSTDTNQVVVEQVVIESLEDILTTPRKPVPPIPKDCMSRIFEFMSLRELRHTTSVSKDWCIVSLSLQKKFWKDGNFTMFDNVVFDTTTGDKIHVFDEEDLSDVFHEKRSTLIYTRVPESYQILGNTTSTHEMSKSIKTHGFPLSSIDSKRLGYNYTNDFYLYLLDKNNVYFLYANNIACYNFLTNKMTWRVKVYPNRKPQYIFVNNFFHNKDYLYVVLPTELITFKKKDGTQSVIVTPKMMKKKERIQSVGQSEKLLVVLYAEAYVNPEEFNIEKVYPLVKSHSVVEENDLNLDKPRIFLFDGQNNFLTGVNLKEDDLHLVMKPSKAPIFCFGSKEESTIRVINEDAQKVHNLTPKTGAKLVQASTHSFLYAFSDAKYFEVLTPETGILVGTTFEKDLVGIHMENAEDTILLFGITKEKQSEMMCYELKDGKFVKKWTQELKWRSTYYEYALEDLSFYSNDGYVFLVRQCTDNRRFLSSGARLDVEIICCGKEDGMRVWERVHECAFDTSETVVEKGYDVVVFKDTIAARSYVFDGFDGTACLTIYTIRTGGVELCKYTNRKSMSEGKVVKSFVPSEMETPIPFKVIRFEEKEKNEDLEEVLSAELKSPRDGSHKEKGQTKNESSAFLQRKGSELTKSMKLAQGSPVRKQESGPQPTLLSQEKHDKEKKCLVM